MQGIGCHFHRVKSARLGIFEYADYRHYLRDGYTEKKAAGPGFSHRVFARRAGIESTNYLKLVMDGKRNLSPEMASRFASGYGLAKQEADFFCELVAFNQAKTSAQRERCYERLSSFRPYRALRKLDGEQATYHSTWYLPAIRELVARDDFRDDPKWIARQLLPRIRVTQARKALQVLETLGLLERDPSGKLRQRDAVVTTGDGPLGHHIVSYHRMMMAQAAEAIDSVPRDLREMSSLTLCVSEEVLHLLRRRIQKYRRELLNFAEREGPPERVVQVNFQLFPLSQLKEESP